MKTGDVKTATALLIMVGEETASNVLKYLNESEIEAISKQISTAGPVAPQESEKSAEDIYHLLFSNRLEGGAEYARKVLMRALEPGSAKRIIDRMSSSQRGSDAFKTI